VNFGFHTRLQYLRYGAGGRGSAHSVRVSSKDMKAQTEMQEKKTRLLQKLGENTKARTMEESMEGWEGAVQRRLSKSQYARVNSTNLESYEKVSPYNEREKERRELLKMLWETSPERAQEHERKEAWLKAQMDRQETRKSSLSVALSDK
jgi:hypothetical protein